MSYNYLDKTGLASVWAKIKAALATKANTADLATVATSGSYSDLGDTPTKVSDFENDAAYMSGMTILAYGKNNWTDFITAYTEKKLFIVERLQMLIQLVVHKQDLLLWLMLIMQTIQQK